MHNDSNRFNRQACTVLMAAAVLSGSLLLPGCGKNAAETTVGAETTLSTHATEPQETISVSIPATVPTTAPTEAGLLLPFVAEEAGLEISEFFASSILNPDSNEELADDVASLEIRNVSGRYLRSAFLQVDTCDDMTFEFRIQDLPADASAWIFDRNNSPVTDDSRIRSITCTDVEFAEPDEALHSVLTVVEEDLTVTVTNNGTDPLENLEIVCHCDFGDLLFGGISYTYPVASLAPGEQMVIDAEECYMGTAKVVDIRCTDTIE